MIFDTLDCLNKIWGQTMRNKSGLQENIMDVVYYKSPFFIKTTCRQFILDFGIVDQSWLRTVLFVSKHMFFCLSGLSPVPVALKD
jgi:hypothetical protein